MSCAPLMLRHEGSCLLGDDLSEAPLTTYAPPEPQAAPKEFEVAVVGLLRDSARRLSPREIVTHLRRSGSAYSTHTVKTYLSRLVAQGILTSSRRKPFGYLLADRSIVLPTHVDEEILLDLIREVGFRMTRSVLLAALSERGLRWDEEEVSAMLARLVFEGQLTCNPYSRPPGYGFPDWR